MAKARGLRSHFGQFDALYSFNSLLTNGTVLPPALSEGHVIANDSTVNASMPSAHVVFSITEPARRVKQTPNWRDYLQPDLTDPGKIDVSFLLRNDEELSQWRSGIMEGWKAGHQQALLQATTALKRLSYDFIGMIRYRVLQESALVGEPLLSETTEPTQALAAKTLEVAVPVNFIHTEYWQHLLQPQPAEPTNE